MCRSDPCLGGFAFLAVAVSAAAFPAAAPPSPAAQKKNKDLGRREPRMGEIQGKMGSWSGFMFAEFYSPTGK